MQGENKPALVALRSRREEIIEKLMEHFSRDAIGVDEFEERVDSAHRATSLVQLNQLIEDLEPVGEGEAPAPASDAAQSEALAIAAPKKKRIITIFGGTDRKGRWRVPEKLRVITVMGGADLDFREAEIGPGVHEVHITTIMGGTDIIVPPTLAVECEGMAIMGGFDQLDRAPTTRDPDQPLLVIKGLALMGGVDIKTRLPGEGSIRAWFRERRERRALAAKQRKQLTEGSKE